MSKYMLYNANISYGIVKCNAQMQVRSLHGLGQEFKTVKVHGHEDITPTQHGHSQCVKAPLLGILFP